MGDRATEVAIVMLEGDRVVDRFQSLMNAGVHVPGFITQLTGITNAMVAAAPPAAQVMAEASRFVGDAPMVAHNASFDRKFWEAELARAGLDATQPFACTVLLSRRLYPQAPSHRLGALADWHRLPRTGQARYIQCYRSGKFQFIVGIEMLPCVVKREVRPCFYRC